MNKLLYILLLTFLFSCKSNSVAQEKKADNHNSSKPKIEKIAFGDPNDNEITNIDLGENTRMEPATVNLKGSIQSLSKNGVICGTSYKVTARVKVRSIINSGRGIVNLLSKGDEVTMAFMNNAPDTDYDALKKKLTISGEMLIKVREGLCPEMTQTVYMIEMHEVVE